MRQPVLVLWGHGGVLTYSRTESRETVKPVVAGGAEGTAGIMERGGHSWAPL